MKAISKKSLLAGHITVPGSKSHTIRALILAAMADDSTETVEAVASVETE
jgi:3-phosphoshikimate 1-carboxyvinyltransferase